MVLVYALPPNASLSCSDRYFGTPSKILDVITRERKVVTRPGLKHLIRLSKSFRMSYYRSELTEVFISKHRHQRGRRPPLSSIQNDFLADEVSCEDARFWYPPAPVTVLLLRFPCYNPSKVTRAPLGAPNLFPIF